MFKNTIIIIIYYEKSCRQAAQTQIDHIQNKS